MSQGAGGARIRETLGRGGMRWRQTAISKSERKMEGGNRTKGKGGSRMLTSAGEQSSRGGNLLRFGGGELVGGKAEDCT